MSVRSLLLPLVLAAALVAIAAMRPVTAQTPQFDAWFEADDAASIEREIDGRLKADPDDRVALIARARLGVGHRDASRLDVAIEAMERCLERDAAAARCHLWLGRAFGRKALEAGMIAGIRYAGRVREHFERAVALDPDAVDARYDLNNFYILSPGIAGGSKARARAGVDDFARRRPGEAALLAAQLDLAEEKYADADAKLLAFAGASDRAVLDVWQDELAALGYAYFSRKPPRLDGARRVFEFAASRFPRNELFMRALGRIAQEQARYEAAASHYEKALAIKPQPGAHYRLAQVAEKLGDTARAIVHYEKTIRWPDGVPAPIARDASERLRALNRL